MLEFGRELFQMSQRLEKENGENETNRKMLEVRSIRTLFHVLCLLLKLIEIFFFIFSGRI